MLRKVRELLKRKGYLSETLLQRTPGMPSTTTLHSHFGTYRQLYDLVGYHLHSEDIFKGEQSKRSLLLRRRLVARIKRLFPEHVSVTRLSANRTRSILLIDGVMKVSLILCARKRGRRGRQVWDLEPNDAERDFITLICTMNHSHNRVVGYYLLPNMRPFKSKAVPDGYLRRAQKLQSLAEFYSGVMSLWAERSCVRRIQASFP